MKRRSQQQEEEEEEQALAASILASTSKVMAGQSSALRTSRGMGKGRGRGRRRRPEARVREEREGAGAGEAARAADPSVGASVVLAGGDRAAEVAAPDLVHVVAEGARAVDDLVPVPNAPVLLLAQAVEEPAHAALRPHGLDVAALAVDPRADLADV
eukprot:3413734-Alexandrium_andersonii.AAC.1